MGNSEQKETFEAFTKSFFYGTRSDLSFKFMSDLSEGEASGFLQDLFKDVVAAIDANDLSGLKQRMVAGQVAGYRDQKNFDYEGVKKRGAFLRSDPKCLFLCGGLFPETALEKNLARIIARGPGDKFGI